MVNPGLILDGARDGWSNMAIDEFLLHRVATTKQPVLRFYQWETATLSLGYFQSLSDRVGHDASWSCPIVRRATGGGAIVHDRELTYSLAVPISDRMNDGHEALYDRIHQVVVQLLVQLGAADSRLHEGQKAEADDPFLCFQRRAKGDVVIGAHKVLGSAQRRQKGGLLQHGSILLERSSAAPELPGIVDLAPGQLSIDEVKERLVDAICDAFSVDRNASSELPLSFENEAVGYRQKFLDTTWIRRR